MVILIVEDEFLIGLTAVLALSVLGYHPVGPAQSGQEALQLATGERPDLAFIDIDLAGDMDGIAIARKLTEQHGTCCVFATGQLERARRAKDVALGVIDKPYDPLVLLDTVKFVAALRNGMAPPVLPRHLELFHHLRELDARWPICGPR